MELNVKAMNPQTQHVDISERKVLYPDYTECIHYSL